jgi:hypothetical protein
VVELEPKMQGKTMLFTLGALPAAKRKRHFFSVHDKLHHDDEEEKDLEEDASDSETVESR